MGYLVSRLVDWYVGCYAAQLIDLYLIKRLLHLKIIQCYALINWYQIFKAACPYVCLSCLSIKVCVFLLNIFWHTPPPIIILSISCSLEPNFLTLSKAWVISKFNKMKILEISNYCWQFLYSQKIFFVDSPNFLKHEILPYFDQFYKP